MITKPESFLKNVPLFVEFDAEELEHLARLLHPSHFAPGDVILQEGNANRALGFILVNASETDWTLALSIAGWTENARLPPAPSGSGPVRPQY